MICAGVQPIRSASAVEHSWRESEGIDLLTLVVRTAQVRFNLLRRVVARSVWEGDPSSCVIAVSSTLGPLDAARKFASCPCLFPGIWPIKVRVPRSRH